MGTRGNKPRKSHRWPFWLDEAKGNRLDTLLNQLARTRLQRENGDEGIHNVPDANRLEPHESLPPLRETAIPTPIPTLPIVPGRPASKEVMG